MSQNSSLELAKKALNDEEAAAKLKRKEAQEALYLTRV